MPWSEHFNIHELIALFNTNRTMSPYIRGKTASGQVVWGLYACMDAGISLNIYVNGKIIPIINDFSYTVYKPKEVCRAVKEDLDMANVIHQQLTPWTIHFWLASGYDTKPYLTSYELNSKKLLDPMSEEGLRRWVKPAPILRAAVGGHTHIRATKTDADYFQPDDAEYFMETGELHPHHEGYQAPKPIASRIATRKNEQLNAWHLARAQKFRKGHDMRVELKSGCGNYATSYTFDDHRHLLHVRDVNPLRELSFQVRLPAHPSSTANSVVGSPAAPFVLRSPPLSEEFCSRREPPSLPYMSPLVSPIATASSLETSRILRPTPIRMAAAESYTDLIVGLSESALDDEKHTVEKNLVEAGQKLQKILSEEERREPYSDKVARLSSEQIAEGLETHHRTMKRIYRNYSDHKDIPQDDMDALWRAEEWCMAAYLELRLRR